MVPTKYTPSYDFSDFEENNPTLPKPGDRLDIEFANIANTTGETIDALTDIRRSDGALKNGIVTLDALASDVQALLGESDYLQIVSDNISQIVEVADDLTNTQYTQTVAVDLTGTNTIGTVAANLTGADTIGTVAADLTGDDHIGTVAGQIANVVTVGENIEDVNRYANTYLPPSMTPPTQRPDGSPLQPGDLWYDETVNEVKKYDGAAFSLVTTQALGGLATGAGTFGFAPDGEVAVGAFTTLFVWVNGILLTEGDDYTQDGSSFTVTSPVEGDEWAYWAYQANDATDYYTKIEADALLGDKADTSELDLVAEAVSGFGDIASAATMSIGGAPEGTLYVTGTTTITSLGTADEGVVRRLIFADALTLTHNATSLILPGSANIATAAGDVATFVSEGSGNWRCTGYERANGTPIKADLNPGAATELTISSGEITVTGSYHTVDTEGDAASDDLDTIDVSALDDGQMFILTAENASRVATVRGGQDNIVLTGPDLALNSPAARIVLQKVGTDVVEVARSPSALHTYALSLSGQTAELEVPRGARRITLAVNRISTSGSSDLLVQLGTATAWVTTSYNSGTGRFSSVNNETAFGATGFRIKKNAAGWEISGVMTLQLTNVFANTWVASFAGDNGGFSGENVIISGGRQSLPDVPTRIRLNAQSGNSFTSGNFSIMVE